MVETSRSSQFAYSLPDGRSVDDELGLWQPFSLEQPVTARESADEQAFSTPGQAATGQTLPVELNHFQAELPGDAELAQKALSDQEARLQQSQWGLGNARRRLEQFSWQGGIPVEASFALPGSQVTSQIAPELALQGLLDTTSSEESFAILPGIEKLPANWQNAIEGASAFFTKIKQLLTVGDLIETKQDGLRLGLTAISLSGDFNSYFGDQRQRSVATIHNRVLGQAIATRAAWLSMSTSIISGAARLAILIPTSPWLAVPAAYQFFRQVLQQAQNWPNPQLQ